MLCDALVIFSSRASKKSGKTYHHKTVMMRQTSHLAVMDDLRLVERFRQIESPTWVIERVEVCGGTIEAKVEAVDEPYYGGTSATLAVTYHCRKCKCIFYHPDLPHEYNIGEWLTNQVSLLPGRDSGSRTAEPATEVPTGAIRQQAAQRVPAASTGNTYYSAASGRRVA